MLVQAGHRSRTESECNWFATATTFKSFSSLVDVFSTSRTRRTTTTGPNKTVKMKGGTWEHRVTIASPRSSSGSITATAMVIAVVFSARGSFRDVVKTAGSVRADYARVYCQAAEFETPAAPAELSWWESVSGLYAPVSVLPPGLVSSPREDEGALQKLPAILYRGAGFLFAAPLTTTTAQGIPCYVDAAALRHHGVVQRATAIRPGVGTQIGVSAVLACTLLMIGVLYPVCGWILERERVMRYAYTSDYNREISTTGDSIAPLASRRFKAEVGYYSLEIGLAVCCAMRFGVLGQLSDDGPGFFLLAFGFLALKSFLCAACDASWATTEMPMGVYLVSPVMQLLSSICCPVLLLAIWGACVGLAVGTDTTFGGAGRGPSSPYLQEYAPPLLLLLWPFFAYAWHAATLADFFHCLRAHDSRITFAPALWRRTAGAESGAEYSARQEDEREIGSLCGRTSFFSTVWLLGRLLRSAKSLVKAGCRSFFLNSDRRGIWSAGAFSGGLLSFLHQISDADSVGAGKGQEETAVLQRHGARAGLLAAQLGLVLLLVFCDFERCGKWKVVIFSIMLLHPTLAGRILIAQDDDAMDGSGSGLPHLWQTQLDKNGATPDPAPTAADGTLPPFPAAETPDATTAARLHNLSTVLTLVALLLLGTTIRWHAWTRSCRRRRSASTGGGNRSSRSSRSADLEAAPSPGVSDDAVYPPASSSARSAISTLVSSGTTATRRRRSKQRGGLLSSPGGPTGDSSVEESASVSREAVGDHQLLGSGAAGAGDGFSGAAFLAAVQDYFFPSSSTQRTALRAGKGKGTSHLCFANLYTLRYLSFLFLAQATIFEPTLFVLFALVHGFLQRFAREVLRPWLRPRLPLLQMHEQKLLRSGAESRLSSVDPAVVNLEELALIREARDGCGDVIGLWRLLLLPTTTAGGSLLRMLTGRTSGRGEGDETETASPKAGACHSNWVRDLLFGGEHGGALATDPEIALCARVSMFLCVARTVVEVASAAPKPNADAGTAGLVWNLHSISQVGTAVALLRWCKSSPIATLSYEF